MTSACRRYRPCRHPCEGPGLSQCPWKLLGYGSSRHIPTAQGTDPSQATGHLFHDGSRATVFSICAIPVELQ